MTKGHADGTFGRFVWPINPGYLWRRWVARNWTCRCGIRVFADGEGCVWHESVRSQVMSGKITRAEDAR